MTIPIKINYILKVKNLVILKETSVKISAKEFNFVLPIADNSK